MSENNKKQVFSDIETENLLLKQISMTHKEFIFKHFNDSKVSGFLVDVEPFTQMVEVEKLINWYIQPEPRDHHRWIIMRKADSALLGTCGYHIWDFTNNSCEIGYDLGSSYWGKGYMTEALHAALKVGFKTMGLNRIQGFVHLQNKRSTNLLLKLGFKQEGIIRDKHYFRGKYYDHYCYSLLRKEYRL